MENGKEREVKEANAHSLSLNTFLWLAVDEYIVNH